MKKGRFPPPSQESTVDAKCPPGAHRLARTERMNCLDALAEIDAELNELTHPLGSIAYQKAGTQRVEPSGRDVLAYDDAPAPPLMDDELAKAKELDAADESQGLLYGRDKGEGKKRKGRDGGVALPKWMDLDQETLPNAPAMSARAKRPPALDAFGGVGELTVQMRTTRGGLGGDRGFDALLSHHERAKGREEARPACARELVRVGPNPNRIPEPEPEPGPNQARLARERGEQTWGVPPEGYVCHICQEAGHWIEQCPHAQPRSSSAGAGTPPEGYVCRLCSVPGHWHQNCPTAAAAAEGGAADGDGTGRAPKAQRTAPLSAEQRVAGAKGKPPAGCAPSSASAPASTSASPSPSPSASAKPNPSCPHLHPRPDPTPPLPTPTPRLLLHPHRHRHCHPGTCATSAASRAIGSSSARIKTAPPRPQATYATSATRRGTGATCAPPLSRAQRAPRQPRRRPRRRRRWRWRWSTRWREMRSPRRWTRRQSRCDILWRASSLRWARRRRGSCSCRLGRPATNTHPHLHLHLHLQPPPPPHPGGGARRFTHRRWYKPPPLARRCLPVAGKAGGHSGAAATDLATRRHRRERRHRCRWRANAAQGQKRRRRWS